MIRDGPRLPSWQSSPSIVSIWTVSVSASGKRRHPPSIFKVIEHDKMKGNGIVLPSCYLSHSHGKSSLLIGTSSIDGSFSIAMLNNQRVLSKHYIIMFNAETGCFWGLPRRLIVLPHQTWAFQWLHEQYKYLLFYPFGRVAFLLFYPFGWVALRQFCICLYRTVRVKAETNCWFDTKHYKFVDIGNICNQISIFVDITWYNILN